MKSFLELFFSNLIELNCSLGILCFAVFLTVTASKGCANSAAQDKLHQQYMVTCVSKGTPPAECALGWKTSRTQ